VGWIREHFWLLVAVALWPVGLLLPYYLASSGHHPPVGTYIAIMGILAAAVTLRKDPPVKEKAAWILLMALVMVAEIRNLYVADAEQAGKFDAISDSLKATKTGLDKTVEGLTEAANRLDGISSGISEAANKSQTQFNDTMSEMTGGSSYLFVDPTGNVGGPVGIDIGDIKKGMMVLSASLSFHGKYSLHDVAIDTYGPIGSSYTYYGTVLARHSVEHAIELGFYPIENKEYWQVWINTSNGMYYQSIFLLKVDNKWVYACRLYKGSPKGKLLKRWHQAGFPDNVSDVWWSKE